MSTLVRIIRVIVAKGVSVLPGIVLESALWWVDAVDVVWTVDGIVCGFEGALAVPSVARVVFGLEGVVDGECEFLFPVLPVGGLRIGGCCRHPPEVRHDILVTQE